MILNCSSCGASFKVDTALLGTNGRSVRCGSCGHSWHQKPPDDDQKPEFGAQDIVEEQVDIEEVAEEAPEPEPEVEAFAEDDDELEIEEVAEDDAVRHADQHPLPLGADPIDDLEIEVARQLPHVRVVAYLDEEVAARDYVVGARRTRLRRPSSTSPLRRKTSGG